MNIANLQLEGLYVAVAAVMTALRDKNLLSETELEAALARADGAIASEAGKNGGLSPAKIDAIRFPLRFLRLANQISASGGEVAFRELANLVGRTKLPADSP